MEGIFMEGNDIVQTIRLTDYLELWHFTEKW